MDLGVFVWSLLLLVSRAHAQLVSDFYEETCPGLLSTVRRGVEQAVQREQRLAASVLRLHFHDCFVNGCDASILLDDTATFTGEKSAGPNVNSARGFEVIDDIKSEVERLCPATVSCADILTLAARDAVVLSGGPSWEVPLGRRDSFGASRDRANRFIPSPTLEVPALISAFGAVGLSASDVVILSGAHTIGAAKCSSFSQRLYNQSGTEEADPSIDPAYLPALERLCPQGGNPNTLARLDVQTPTRFDNSYYSNLLAGRGLLNSDQALFRTDSSVQEAVQQLAGDENLFFDSFASAMVRLGSISPLSGEEGEIRTNCRVSSTS